ncbi:MAG: hypothetical protein KME18_25740 [Phormidium tanganyikae FI6-MK23]|jgi:hypothetical protein|nr:hypothetical protein [Phormidium tanganyikae FI6-MK23]
MPELEGLEQLIDRLTQSRRAVELAEIQQTLFEIADVIELRLWALQKQS